MGDTCFLPSLNYLCKWGRESITEFWNSQGKCIFVYLSILGLFRKLCVFVCLCLGLCMWVQRPVEPRRQHQTPYSWDYRHLWATQHGCWEPKSGPLQEQYEIFITEPSSWTQIHLFLSSSFFKYSFNRPSQNFIRAAQKLLAHLNELTSCWPLSLFGGGFYSYGSSTKN